MESPSKGKIVEILDKYGLGPLKRLGQNFLVDGKVASRMADLIDPGEIVVEVGPGLGSLTIPAAKRAREVITVEKDLKLAQAFEIEFLSEIDNITLIKGDVLKVKGFVPSGEYSVLANLPFYVTSPIIRMFLESENPPVKMILMMQREVAKRICSKPPEMSILAVSVQFYAEPKIVFNVPRNAFWPPPQVDCSVIEIRKRKSGPETTDPNGFFKVVKAGFSRPRAQLLNNLSKGLRLDKETVEEVMTLSGIDPKRRAESLSIDEWVTLSKKVMD